MKKINFKFASEELTKTQMKNIVGGSEDAHNCSARILCASGYSTGGLVNCDDDSDMLCQIKSGAGNDYSISCDCTDN